MKKLAVYGLACGLILTALAGCTKIGPPVAGSAKAEQMLTLLPKDTSGVIIIDIHRAMNLDIVVKALKENARAEMLQKFIQKSGIDPQKDVFFLAIGIRGSGEARSGVGIVNLKYAKDALLAKLKDNEAKFGETVYEGVPTISVEEEDGGKPMLGAFLDASNIAIGPEADVKAVIDGMKKGESAVANAELMAQIKGATKTALAWGVFAFKPEEIKKMIESAPMLGSLASLKGVLLGFDYKNKILDAEFKIITADAGKNKEIADMLNGFRAMGSLAAGEKPEIGELMNKIEITSGADNVRIHAALPEQLLDKLGKMAETEIMNKLGGAKIEEPAKNEEKKEDKKAEEIKK